MVLEWAVQLSVFLLWELFLKGCLQNLCNLLREVPRDKQIIEIVTLEGFIVIATTQRY